MSEEQFIKVDIRPWAEGDLSLLERLLGDPAMMAHLGGPESPQQIRERHARYCRGGKTGQDAQFVIVMGPEWADAGWIGYWEKEWQGHLILETGWSVLPEFQGKGIATRATNLLVERARSDGKHRFLQPFHRWITGLRTPSAARWVSPSKVRLPSSIPRGNLCAAMIGV